MLNLYLLGTFKIILDGDPVTGFATDKARALLAYLALESDRPQSRDGLAGLLWPDQPEKKARQNLRQTLLYLRQALCADDSCLLIDRDTAQFDPGGDYTLDVTEFQALSRACRQHRHRQPETCLPCIQRRERQAALYRGEFLEHFYLSDSALFEEWATLQREWLHREAVEALFALTEFHTRRGDLARAREFARRQVELEPWREEAHRQLMRLLALEGQRSAALAQYETCRRILRAEFDVEPAAETAQLWAHIKAGNVAPPRPAPALPLPPTPFVGREAELRDLTESLADPDCRLVTLTGPGGIGKTRLALELAEAHRGVYPDGVVWVALDAIQAASLIVPTIAQGLGLTLYGKEPPEAQLRNYLRERTLLLALDNAEHLPELGALADRLLRGVPGLTLLVTSRERLALREEWLFAVEGLAQPDRAALFVQTARRTHRKFAPGPEDLAAIDAICRLVEGMPLALELAAPRIIGRSCAALARDLATGLDALQSTLRNAPERHRSVRAAFEHSWERLPDAEREVFARLAVFRGSFTAEAVRAVVGDAADCLPGLIAQSLVRHLPDGRYQLHGLLRQFAAEKLAAEEATTTAARHAAFYAVVLAERERDLKGAEQDVALQAIARDLANARQAWTWAAEHHRLDVFRRAQEGLFVFLALRSWYQEGATLFARAATAVGERDPLLLGGLLARQARCSEFTRPAEEATALYERSLTFLQGQHAERETALPLYGLGYMAHLRGDYAAARQYFEESLTRYEAAGNRWGAANVLSSLCLTLRREGDFAAARDCGLQSLAIRRDLGDRRGIASSQNNVGLVQCALGEYAAAERALRESLTLCRELEHTIGAANALTGLCHVMFRAGDVAKATQYQQDALALFREVGDLWGVALALNNLGQLALECEDAATARPLLEEAVAGYRRAGVQSGLPNTLGNLGRACEMLGEVATAAYHFHAALTLALELHDLPFGLEILTRGTALLADQQPAADLVSVLTFILRHPALLGETRRTATALQTRLQATIPPEHVESVAPRDFQAAAAIIAVRLDAIMQSGGDKSRATHVGG